MMISDLAIQGLFTGLLKALTKGPKVLRIIFLVSALLFFVGLTFGITSESQPASRKEIFNTIAITCVVLSAIAITGIYAFQLVKEEEEQINRIRSVESRAIENPSEPTAAWDLATIKLESYLNRNLKQVQWIFYLTSMVMTLGFAILLYGIYHAYNANTSNTITLLTCVTGIIVQFIGASFLVIYKSTMQQAKDNIEVLERINAVGMSMQILESISSDEAKLQNQTRADIAKQLIMMYSNTLK